MKVFSSYLTTFFLFVSIFSFAQQVELSAFLIPQELREDANAVVRDKSTVVTISNIDEMTVQVSSTITVLNKLGDRYARATVYYDNDKKIVDLNAEIYDMLGKRIKKIKKKDFSDFSAVDGVSLYTDDRLKQLDYTPTQYPYTIKLSYEFTTSTTAFIPGWIPLRGYYLGIERSTYKIINPASLDLRIKKNNFDGYAIKDKSSTESLSFVMENQKPIQYERSTEYSFDIFPLLKVASNSFALEGVQGSASNWKEFGLWMDAKLLQGTNQLNPATVTQVKALVAHTNDPIEKAKIIYQFMQNKTRYVSVQMGIGGWKPIAANQVDKVGYGDCKGLTNYTKALLDAVGVTSYYTVVYADEKRNIDKDFASIQGNHVILNIPNGEDDIWLECTNQMIPFGFLGDFTDDRDVLVITPEGGVIKRTPAYLNEDNLQKMKANVELDAEGNMKATVTITSKGIQYDDRFDIDSYSKEDLKKYYKTNFWNYNNNLQINSAETVNDKDAIVFSEKVSASIDKYATIQQGAYLFKVNMFNRNGYVPKRYRKRAYPLRISRGFKDVDEFSIKLPEGYRLESTPSDIVLENKFGQYKLQFKQVDNETLLYTRELFIKAGTYPKEDYKPYRSFRKKVAKYDGLRLSLIKKS